MKRIVGRVLWGLAATGVALPAWAEHAATSRIDQAVAGCDGSCESPSVDVDLGGLSLRGAVLDTARVQGHAELVRVEPRLDGIHVRVRGLDARLIRRAPANARDDGGATTPPKATPSSARQHPLPGVPIHVEIEGTVSVDGPRETRLVAIDPRLELGADGAVTGQLSGRVERRGALVASARQVTVEGASLAADEWTVSAQVDLGGAQPIPVAGRVGRSGATVYASAGGGHVDARANWSSSQQLVLEAHELGLAFLPHVSGLDEIDVDLAQARLDGTIELSRRDSGVDARLDGVRLAGAVVEAGPLSKEPMYMQDIGVDGRLRLTREEVSGALELAHGQLVSLLSGRVSRADVDVGLSLEPIPCQALLDSMPRGFLPTLEGMQLEGEMSASANVRFAFADLARRRAREVDDTEEPEPPGEVDLDFPFLDRCEVVRDAPGIDLDALDGNYRHRFLTAGGAEQGRILAGGADGFVTIAAAPEIARAFVLLEDARFWYHDGFDREQIERAFWHNLGVEGFSRGASTITQQTARNLWLGHERTLGRKLQEALLTARLERELDKRRILEIYMNIIELGPEVHGVADAAQLHFGRAAHELNTLQALHLASLAPAPVTYSRRFANGEVDAQWRDHLDAQVERLRVHGFLSRIGAQEAKRMPLGLLVRDL